jgi:NAD(P)-dependent dehydrogenase (short-subunit alcohol dehydrogenase family)
MSHLEGRVALVTGGSRGIGAAIAQRLARDGADVALTYARASERTRAIVDAISAGGHRAIAIAADSADPAKIEGAVNQAVSAFGKIDILVNNAGIFPTGSLETLSVEVFDETFSVNIRSVFVASKIARRIWKTVGALSRSAAILPSGFPGQA